MRYNEVEELEATGEWLLRIKEKGFSEELMYVPSQLSKLGVAPIDVVDRLEWLRDHRHDPKTDHGTVVEVVVPEQQAPEPEVEVEDPEALVVEPGEMLEGRLLIFVSEPMSLALDYDGYGPWEWAEPMERFVEDAISAILDEDPGLHDFNELAAMTRVKKRTKGKRARAASAAKEPEPRVYELVSVDSVGTST